jgi:hypothetical protein
MAKQPGPVPKRSEERIRRNIDPTPIDKVQAYGAVVQPPLAIDNPHPLVIDFYHSLGESAQSKYFEPSDWQYARIVCDYLNQELRFGGKRSAQMLAAINSMLVDLLVTEGQRRRVRMEVERQSDHGGSVIDVAALFRNRASNG